MNRFFSKLRDKASLFTTLLKSKVATDRGGALLSAVIVVVAAVGIWLIASTLPDFPFIGFFLIGFLTWPFLLIWFASGNRVNFLIFLSGVIGADLVIAIMPYNAGASEVYTTWNYLKDFIWGQVGLAWLVWGCLLTVYLIAQQVLESLLKVNKIKQLVERFL